MNINSHPAPQKLIHFIGKYCGSKEAGVMARKRYSLEQFMA